MGEELKDVYQDILNDNLVEIVDFDQRVLEPRPSVRPPIPNMLLDPPRQIRVYNFVNRTFLNIVDHNKDLVLAALEEEAEKERKREKEKEQNLFLEALSIFRINSLPNLEYLNIIYRELLTRRMDLVSLRSHEFTPNEIERIRIIREKEDAAYILLRRYIESRRGGL
ncbi:hypothetical protein HYV57_03230 [Candidatus Peregrinibacteria bacterium]|nr:hypothetical protein [Candidatus Peregrinibacteria bacterium]